MLAHVPAYEYVRILGHIVGPAWSSCSQAKKRRSTSFGFKSYITQFPYFWIIPMALRHFEMARWVTPNDSANSSCVWYESSVNNAFNSESSKIFSFHPTCRFLDIKITTLEALKLLTKRSFTKSSITIGTWEHLMSLSYSFLQMKAENQNFPQMTRISFENWHLWSRINL